MDVIFTPKALSDLNDWKKSGNITIQKKIETLLQSICISPYKGIGKPEPLKHSLSGKWSRRIDRKHRLIYEFKDDTIYVLSLKGHY